MSREEVYRLIAQVFSLPPDFAFEPKMRPASIPGWDSIGWMRMLLAVEEIANCEVPLELFDRVVTVDDFCTAVAEFMAKEKEGT